MSNLVARLDDLKKLMQEDDFLKGRGLSNEVNIRIFCYDPKEEMKIRSFVDRLMNENLKTNIYFVDLYETLLTICEKRRILDRMGQMEKKKGKEYIEEYFKNKCNAESFAEEIIAEMKADADVLLITGVGKVFPFLRAHSLLNALKDKGNMTKPIIVLYPGTFDGHYVKLFNQLKPNEYYRAFNTI